MTYEWTDVCVRVDGRVSVRTCVDTFTSRAPARTKIRSTRVDLISVRLGFSLHIYSIGKVQTYRRGRVSVSKLCMDKLCCMYVFMYVGR